MAPYGSWVLQSSVVATQVESSVPPLRGTSTSQVSRIFFLLDRVNPLRNSPARGTIRSWSAALPSNHSTTPFRSVIETNAPIPASRTCFMYSATEASRASHATSSDSKVTKSLGAVPGSDAVEEGLRKRVGVALGSVVVRESRTPVAACNDATFSPELPTYFTSNFAFIALRRAMSGSVLAIAVVLGWCRGGRSCKII